jgi:histone H3/H4
MVLIIATVQKIIQEILQQDGDGSLVFARESRDLLIECCVEFVTLISSEANDIAEKEAKKTIACEHVTAALNQLGYPSYVPEIQKVAQEHKLQQAVRICSE